MAESSKASSQANKHFENLVSPLEPELRKRAKNIVYRYSGLLEVPDADDIFVIALMKVWNAYFAPNASQQYEQRSKQEDEALFTKALQWAAQDLIRRKKRDREVMSAISLDEQIDGNDESSGSYQEINGTGLFSNFVELEIDVEAAIEHAVTDPVHKLVAYYLWGKVERELLSEYSDNYIRVTAHRIRKKILQYLNNGI